MWKLKRTKVLIEQTQICFYDFQLTFDYISNYDFYISTVWVFMDIFYDLFLHFTKSSFDNEWIDVDKKTPSIQFFRQKSRDD